MLTGGVDVGSVSSQAVIMADGKLYAYSNMRTGSDSPESARKAMEWALGGTGLALQDIHFVVGTGYGRVNVPFAQRAITEIACHARGANFMYGPAVRTVLDMGGQDCKAIRCDEKGKVAGFLMNDKCAAGTGRGMEVIADLLAVPIEEVGELSLSVDEEPPPVSSTCVVFAKSEASGLLRAGWPKNKRARRLLRGHGAPGVLAARPHRRGEGVRHHRRHRQEPRRRQPAREGARCQSAQDRDGQPDRRRAGRGAVRPRPLRQVEGVGPPGGDMLANFGYKDGSGDFFITVDTDACVRCTDHPCLVACPAGVLEIIVDDYDDRVCAVKDGHRKQIKYSCAPCKPATGRPVLPCVAACPAGALAHSW